MDFTPDETQREIAELTAGVLDKAGDDGDRAWRGLAEAGLLALSLPAELGGDGLGVAEVAAVLTETGRVAAPVPALATLALGVLPLGALGTPGQRAELLPEAAESGAVLTAALHEPSDPLTIRPATTAVADDGAWRLTGTKIGVPYAGAARRVLVPATLPGGTGVFLVDPHGDGVTLTATPTSSGSPEHTLRLDGAVVADTDLLGSAGAGRALRTLHRFALAGTAAIGDGALAGALALTTGHLGTREQFGRPLATFQAVAQEIADVYVASRTVHLAATSAVWRLGAGLDPDGELDIAAYWLAEQAPRALAACHHLHGGVGLDVTYPLHRYSSLVKDLVRGLGGVESRLERVGALVGGA
ncbi:acyl-CoA dehydrogenase family protein [Prauserella cavernicola]|uniref:Acyl-CoA/acyl-ACP dehydrogenase n=1 Tax=Prauserella cavernicola TaxID=2800127 RepID=A0A934R0N0_9PSEU|nr:acyl-CoA dehydrogenase family protein [Prauserella cavernicola]MBK1788678.1 acyl-CoA/acyl-ACP dehydrogenase [Prauserella cavernicola]